MCMPHSSVVIWRIANNANKLTYSVRSPQTINQSDDDQTAANPMLYGPLHGAKISKTNQYLATVIRESFIHVIHFTI